MASTQTTLASNRAVPTTVASKQLKGKVGIIMGRPVELGSALHVRLHKLDPTSC